MFGLFFLRTFEMYRHSDINHFYKYELSNGDKDYSCYYYRTTYVYRLKIAPIVHRRKKTIDMLPREDDFGNIHNDFW